MSAVGGEVTVKEDINIDSNLTKRSAKNIVGVKVSASGSDAETAKSGRVTVDGAVTSSGSYILFDDVEYKGIDDSDETTLKEGYLQYSSTNKFNKNSTSADVKKNYAWIKTASVSPKEAEHPGTPPGSVRRSNNDNRYNNSGNTNSGGGSKTSDNNSTGVWVLLMTVSALGAGIVLKKKMA